MNDDNSRPPERPAFPEPLPVTTTEGIAAHALTPFATLGPSERWLHDILSWAYGQPDLHAAHYCYELGRCLRQSGRHRAAWPALEVALAIYCRQEGQEPLASSLSEIVLAALGELLDDIVEKPEAVAYLRRALVVWRAVHGLTHPEIGEILNNLGYWCRRSGRLGRARDCYRQALAIWQKTLGPEHASIAAVLNNLAVVAREAGRPAEACRNYRQALTISQAIYGPTHPTTGSILANLGAACRDDGDEENAERFLTRALAILETTSAGLPLELAVAYNNMGHLLLGRGEYGRAHRFFRRALSLYEKASVERPLEVASVLHNLGTLYCATGSLDAAMSVLARAYKLRCRRLGPQHPGVVAISRILHEALTSSRQHRFPSSLDLSEARLN